MFCTKCGASNSDDTNFCIECGASLADTQAEASAAEPAAPAAPAVPAAPAAQATYQAAAPTAEKGKGLAIASMVLGIVSFFCFGIITGIIAVILGAVSKNQGCKSGMATAGIVCGLIGLILSILVIILAGSLATLIPFI